MGDNFLSFLSQLERDLFWNSGWYSPVFGPWLPRGFSQRVVLGGLGSGLDMGEVVGILGGGWRILFYLGHIIMEGLRLGFGIWAGIPPFLAVVSMKAFQEGDVRRFGVGFGRGGS